MTQSASPPLPPHPVRPRRRWTDRIPPDPAARPYVVATIVVWVLTVVTGIVAMMLQSTAAATYDDMESLRTGWSWRVWLRRLHLVFGVGAMVMPLATMLVSAVEGWGRRLTASAFGLTLVSAATAIVGLVLPWGQIALWSFTAGSGWWELAGFDQDVRFVLVGDTEVSATVIDRLRSAHTLWLPGLSAVSAAVLSMIGFSRRSATA